MVEAEKFVYFPSSGIDYAQAVTGPLGSSRIVDPAKSAFVHAYISQASEVPEVVRIFADTRGDLRLFTVYRGGRDVMKAIFRAEARTIDAHPGIPVTFDLAHEEELTEATLPAAAHSVFP